MSRGTSERQEHLLYIIQKTYHQGWTEFSIEHIVTYSQDKFFENVKSKRIACLMTMKLVQNRVTRPYKFVRKPGCRGRGNQQIYVFEKPLMGV